MSLADAPTTGAGDAVPLATIAGKPPRDWPRFWRECLLFPAIRLTLFYAAFCGLLVFCENWLVFPGGRSSDALYAEALQVCRNFTQRPVEEVTFSAPGGPKLAGWFVDNGPGSPVVLILHGNGGDVVHASQYLHEAHAAAKASALLMDYRGYGRSEGTASAEGLIADSRAGRKWLAERCGVAESDVILWGQSMGGAMAIDLAQDGAKGLLLEYTFSSLRDAAARNYFMFPVRYLMRNDIDSIPKIRRVACPTYIAHGDADTLVPYDQSEVLFAACGASQKRHFRLAGVGHFTPWIEPLWAIRQEFFAEMNPPVASGAEQAAVESR